MAWWGPPESAVVQCCVGCLMLRWRLCASRPTFLMCRRVGPRAMCFASAANQWMPSFSIELHRRVVLTIISSEAQ